MWNIRKESLVRHPCLLKFLASVILDCSYLGNTSWVSSASAGRRRKRARAKSYCSVARLVLANRGWSRNSKTRPAKTARPGLRFNVRPITRGDGMWVKGGVSLDFFRQLAQFLSNSCRCPDGATRRSLPLPAASSCLLRRRQRLGPRRSCGRERRRARSGRCRQCGTTSARQSRR